MNPHTSVNNSKNRDAFLVNQKETAAAYEWDSLDFSEKITTCESEKSRYDDGAFVKKIICKSYDPYLDDFITINTVAYDINKNGLVFTTNQPLEVGDPIFIKAKTTTRRDTTTHGKQQYLSLNAR